MDEDQSQVTATVHEDEKFNPDPINEEEVEMAKILVKQLHPIRQTHIHIAFPWACCLVGVLRKNCCSDDNEGDQINNETSLLDKDFVTKIDAKAKENRLLAMQQKQQIEDKQALIDMRHTDPYETMGYGLIAYRQTLFLLAVAFIFLSMLVYPIINIYEHGTYDGGSTKSSMMLGHLGYADVECETAEFVMESLIVTCQYGQINSLISAGLNDPEAKTELDENDRDKTFCKIDEDPTDLYANQACSNFIDRTYFNDFFDTNCREKASCTIDFKDGGFFTGDVEAGDTTVDDDSCLSNPMTQFFVQYTCEETNMDALSQKYDDISLICAIILFVGFCFILLIYYMQSVSKLEQKTYDMNTITAADFTVEFDISRDMWEEFEGNEYKKDEYAGMSMARAFKRELKTDIERELTKSIKEKKGKLGADYAPTQPKSPRGQKPKKKKKVAGAPDERDPDVVNIIDITFAFNNHRMINLLKKRGAAITALNFDKMRSCDQDLTTMIHDDDLYDDFTRPVCAFITFESDDHYNEACSFAKKSYFQQLKNEGDDPNKVPIEVLGNNNPEFTPATEPTNIIWENRHIKGVKFGLRACSAITVVIFMLIITFVVILVSKSTSIENQALIPKRGKDFCPTLYGNIGMGEVFDDYKNRKDELFAKEEKEGGGWHMVYQGDPRYDGEEKPYFNKLFYLAGLEYLDWASNNFETQMNGPLQCFCTKQVQKDFADDANYFLTFEWEDVYGFYDKDNQYREEQICKRLVEADKVIFVINECIKFGIIAVNVMIRMAVIAIISYIGCSTESHQMTYITDSVFLCQFFNTGFLLMLCGANLTEQPILNIVPFLPVGRMSDFNSAWFDQLGVTIAGSLTFGAVFPIANEIGQMGKRTTFRLLDKLPAANGLTRKTTIQQYVNLHSGPEYFMHYKYSGVMNVVFLTCMFGAGMPQLFPVAALSFLVLYSVETFMLYYVYKKPPDYDEKLNDSILSNMAKAPLFLYAFGYWMLSNKQLLQTYPAWDPETQTGGLRGITYKGEAFQADHYWYEFFNPAYVFRSGPAGSLLLAFWLYFFYLVARTPVSWCVNQCCGKYVLHDVEIDDDIDRYQNCLDDDDKEWSELEEQGLNKFGIRSKFPESMDLMKRGHMKDEKMHLTGVHCYDILRNPSYHQAFQYFAVQSDRAGLIRDDDKDEGNDEAQSDIVAIALNLAYLTKEEIDEMKFDKVALTEVSKKHPSGTGIN